VAGVQRQSADDGPRRGLGGWLEGVTATPAGPDTAATRVSLVRRALGLAIDWGFALLIANGLMRSWGLGQFAPLLVLLSFHVLLVGTAGYTVGHRLTGLTVRTVDGGLPGPVRALVRGLLLCLAVPPLITGRDGRGLHDRAAGTRVVRR
jgi:uncharacterized RDD family membrane protein YckC